MANDIHTTILDKRRKCFHLADGTVVEFSAMLDRHCNITDDVSEAVIAIYMLSDGRYKAIDLRLLSDTDGNEPTMRLNCDNLECEAVNLRGRFFRLCDNGKLPFSIALDHNLQPTNSHDEMTVAIYLLPEGLYRGVDLRIFTEDHPDMLEALH